MCFFNMCENTKKSIFVKRKEYVLVRENCEIKINLIIFNFYKNSIALFSQKQIKYLTMLIKLYTAVFSLRPHVHQKR